MCDTWQSELVWLQIMPFVCRFVDLSEVADPAHWSWLSPTTDFRQGRKAFLMTPPEFWLTYIACVYLDGLLQGLRFIFFWERWNPSTIKSWCWGFSFLKIKVAVLALLDFPRFVREILKKTDLEGKDLPLIFGQSLVGHSLYCQNHDSPNVQTWCEEMSPQILRVSECLSLALHWKLLLELAPEHGQLFL